MAGDPFEDAFDTLIREDGANATTDKDGKKTLQTTAPNPPPADPAAAAAAAATQDPAADPAAAPPAAENPNAAPPPVVGEEPASEIEETGGEPAPPAEDPNKAKGGIDNDALTRLADMLAERDQRRTQQTQPQQQQPTPAFNQEDSEFIQNYVKDFPDVARAEALIRRVEYNALTAHIFREVAGYFAPKLALLEQLADTTAYSELTQRVPNYDAMRDQVVEWVKTQPKYLQAGMNNVIAAGTADEIEDLFGRFAQATGAASPQPNAGIAPQPQAGRQASPSPARSAAELSPAAKQAAARLAPVNGKRSAPTQAAPLTFDAAFDTFAKEASG